ncbi:hypothetical protein D3C78_1255730 [compost metagenome]
MPDRGFYTRTHALAILRLDHAAPDSATNSVALGAQARDGYRPQIEANRETKFAGFNVLGLQTLNCQVKAAAKRTSQPCGLRYRFLFVSGIHGAVTGQGLHAVSNEAHSAAFEVGGDDPLQLCANDVQCPHDIICFLVDVLGYVGRESIDIRIEAYHLLPLRVAGGQRIDVHIAQRWCLAGELVTTEWVLLQVLTPLFDDLVGRDIQFGRVLTRLNLCRG